MTHARTSIRNAVVAALIAASVAEGRVYAGRRRRLPNSRFPMLIVRSDSESSSIVELRDLYERTLRLEVMVLTRNATGDDDGTEETSADRLAEDVEAVLVDGAIAGAHAIELVSTQINDLSDGDARFTGATLTYQIRYLTAEGQPGTAL